MPTKKMIVKKNREYEIFFNNGVKGKLTLLPEGKIICQVTAGEFHTYTDSNGFVFYGAAFENYKRKILIESRTNGSIDYERSTVTDNGHTKRLQPTWRL